jgi:hypothetical protein
MIATIKEGDEIILQDIDVSLWERSGTLKSWGGSFDSPQGKYIDPPGPYTIVFSDGRTAEILIERAVTHNAGQTAHFRGNGNLA